MKFTNVSANNIEAVRDTLHSAVYMTEDRGSFEDCWSGVTVTFTNDSFEIKGGCCWDCDTSTIVHIAIEAFDWPRHKELAFFEALDEIANNENANNLICDINIAEKIKD